MRQRILVVLVFLILFFEFTLAAVGDDQGKVVGTWCSLCNKMIPAGRSCRHMRGSSSSGNSGGSQVSTYDPVAALHTEGHYLNEAGIKYYNEKNWLRAVECFASAVKKWPENKILQNNLENTREILRQEAVERERLQKETQSAQDMRESISRFASTLNDLPLLENSGLDFDGGKAVKPPVTTGLEFMTSQPAPAPAGGVIPEKLFEKGTRDSAPVDSHVLQEKNEFTKMRTVWMKNEKKLIQQRLIEPNRWSSSIYTTLKTKEPPMPFKKFDELKAGDVLLVSPDDALSKSIRFADRLSSWEWESPASHTVLYLKEVNGKKLFLDSTSGGGPRIITGEEFLKKYGKRGAQVAELGKYEVAQPLSKEEGNKLWTAARELSMKELADKSKKSNNPIDKTNYGLYGNDNMVCSETSRWALIKAGRQIPDTGSPYKKLFGVYFGPSNFYNAEQYFILTPLGVPKQ